MGSPLNPALYGRLREEFGYVHVAHAGAAASVRYGPDPLTNRMKLNISSSGEYYRVNCPHCGDRRGRLWVNHLWGVLDDVTDSLNLWLAHCYNENCMARPGRSQELYDRIYGFRNANLRGQQVVILPGEIEEQRLVEVTPPGLLLRMDKVPPADPSFQYLRSKGYDPVALGEYYGVSLCIDADNDYPMASGRIVIPIRMNGVLVGWQCRYPGDLDWKVRGIPKYYSRPNMARRLMLYNYDTAKDYPFVVVSEGPSDVWNIGTYGVAAFGKHLTQQQLELVCMTWETAVVIMLDGDAWEDTVKLADRFREQNYKGAIIPVRLPEDKDPGSLNPDLIADALVSASRQQGVDLLQLEKKQNDNYDPISRSGYRPGLARPELRFGGEMVPGSTVPDYSFDRPRNASGRS
jgi:hypothetical protein